MPFNETNRPLSRRLDHTEMDTAPNGQDFLRLISSQRDISSARDKGKGVLSPRQQKWLREIPIAENGERAPKIVELASVSTLEHPILLGEEKKWLINYKGVLVQNNIISYENM